jgi:hypothetical protein
MSGKQVLIISSNGLFREGLKHILANTAVTRQTTSLQGEQEKTGATSSNQEYINNSIA